MKLRPFALSLTAVVVSLATAVTPTSAQEIEELFLGENAQQIVSELELTDEQQDDLQALLLDTHSQIQEVLTPNQQEALTEALKAGKDLTQALRSVNLTTAQRAELRAIAQGTRQEFTDELLTEEQAAQLQDLQAQSGQNPGLGRRRR